MTETTTYIPASVSRAAGDLQAAFRQSADIKAEVKERNDALKLTDEYEEVAGIKKRKKALEAANEQFKVLAAELKAAQEKLRATEKYKELAQSRKQAKEFKDAVQSLARTISHEITGTRPAED